jgi:ActR/RegA family two-component response regulator
MPEVVLLISNYEKNDRWCQSLREALGPLDLEIQRERAALGCVARNRYALIIVDASATEYAVHLIRSLRSHQPGAHIVVFFGFSYLATGARGFSGRSDGLCSQVSEQGRAANVVH